MAQQVKELARQAWQPSLLPGTHTKVGKWTDPEVGWQVSGFCRNHCTTPLVEQVRERLYHPHSQQGGFPSGNLSLLHLVFFHAEGWIQGLTLVRWTISEPHSCLLKKSFFLLSFLHSFFPPPRPLSFGRIWLNYQGWDYKHTPSCPLESYSFFKVVSWIIKMIFTGRPRGWTSIYSN